ncbi:HTH domain-containing protein [Allobaculum sp. Allo2]|uniref:HTH domain-containing protein n=1 Tax=Allobaculum sp. Allo2 TaxID=2853432 RepID=UPI001F61E9F5|nr:HTH domain-containing protein [Allobaculum sp. Allo2]UNT92868.1 hypothetical protein KWG61_12505 [Allobaculum sp. Allo2]
MPRSCFTQDQVKVLSENPNTDFVSAHSIRFTPAFKDQLWKYVQSGKNPRDVFEKAGYDLNWIGQRRIDNLVQKLQKQREPRENNTVPAWKYQKALAEAEALRREIDSLKEFSVSLMPESIESEQASDALPQKLHTKELKKP